MVMLGGEPRPARLHQGHQQEHHSSHMKALRQSRSGNLRAGRAVAAWLMLLAAATPLPALANARYECSMGMAQAGPACPRCHGHEAESSRRPNKSRCCREVVDAAPTGTAPAIQTIAGAHAFAVLLPAVRALGAESSVPSRIAADWRRLRPMLPASSVILRL